MFKFKFLTLLTLAVMSLTRVFAFENGQTVRLCIGDKSLMIENSSLDQSKNAVLWTETNTNSQRWMLEEKGNGTFYITNVYSEFYLGSLTTMTAGSAVGQISKSAALTRGCWELVPVDGEEGVYNIFVNTARRIALASEEEITEGSKVYLANASTVEPERIKWKIEVVEVTPNHFTKDMRDDMMNKWKAKYYKKASSGYVIGNGGWWGDAEMFEIVLDAYETTGDKTYATMFENLYTNFLSRNKSTWYKQGVSGYNQFNDDIAWMCIACVRGYLLTGQTKFLNTSKTNFNGMFSRADCYGNDLLQWKHTPGTGSGTNACINGPASVCACYLAIATSDTSYYAKAKKTYEANRNFLYEFKNGKFTGKVFDSGDYVNKTYNYWASTYNQGTCLGAAILLYEHYGDPKYKEDADAIVKWTKSNLANGHGLIHVCQTVSGDLCGFKGILMRYIRMYAEKFGETENYDWIAKNAYHAWNNRNSSGITSSAWLTKAEENFKHIEGDSEKTFGNEGCFTCVSAAFNAHLGAVDEHNAYSRVEAEDFNFIRYADVQDSGNDDDGTGMVEALRNTNYVGYKDVDFSTDAASHLTIRGYLSRANAKLNVFADAPNEKKGKLICTISGEDFTEMSKWETIQKQLSTPIEGKHDIYFVGSGLSGVNLMSLNWFEFKSENKMYGDVTNMGGKIVTSSSDTSTDLSALTDDKATTGVTLSLDSETSPWVEYQSIAPVRLQGYILHSGLEEGDPESWTLLGSTDGKTWETLHTQDKDSISVRGQRFAYDVNATKEYTYFRLQFKMKENASTLSLAEWQLLGKAVSANDITADGGEITEGMETLIDHEANASLTSPLTAVYHSCGNYLLYAYSITSCNEAAPTSWTLEGSVNGTSWKAIDTKSDYVFPYVGSTSVFNVTLDTPYIYYRLKSNDAESYISQWQLFGTIDYGQFYQDITSWAMVTASDGSDTHALVDDNGSTCASVSGDGMKWTIETAIPVKMSGFSITCGSDPKQDPSSVDIIGIDENGDSTVLVTRTLTFAARGSKATYTLSTSKTFTKFEVRVTEGEGEDKKVNIGELELYGTAICDESSTLMPQVEKTEASADALTTSETVVKLNDQQRLTRYRCDFSSPVSITYTYTSPVRINCYSITAAKDNVSFDPKSWVLEASDNGEDWNVIDTREGQLFSNRYATQLYALDKDAEYTIYRLTVTDNNGGAQLHLAELQFLFIDDIANSIDEIAYDGKQNTIVVNDGIISVTSPVPAFVDIFNKDGQKISTHHTHAGTTSIPLPQRSGLYIISAQIDGKRVVLKALK